MDATLRMMKNFPHWCALDYRSLFWAYQMITSFRRSGQIPKSLFS